MFRLRVLRRRGPRPRALLAIAIPLVLGVLAFASPTYVIGVSMRTTIAPGSVLLVDWATPRLEVQRGEVVLFRPPVATSVPLFVKRIVGLPGERVSIHDGRVYIDGVLLDEPYLAAGQTTTTDAADFEVTVPSGSVFVLGDNRADSWDSRNYGCIPTSSILGHAWLEFQPSISIAVL